VGANVTRPWEVSGRAKRRIASPREPLRRLCPVASSLATGPDRGRRRTTCPFREAVGLLLHPSFRPTIRGSRGRPRAFPRLSGGGYLARGILRVENHSPPRLGAERGWARAGSGQNADHRDLPPWGHVRAWLARRRLASAAIS
jgi:hypothetical protein